MLKRYGKVILFDTLALFCFIGVVLFGWLPGPGGIPLFLLGLSLLAINHDWAERWLETAKHKGISFKKWLFPETQWIRHAYDIGSVLLAGAAIYTLMKTDNRYTSAVSLAVMIFALFVLLVNRERFDKFSNFFKKKT